MTIDPLVASGMREHFGDVVGTDYSASDLPGERDLNIKITVGEDQMVLKVYADDDRQWLLLRKRAAR